MSTNLPARTIMTVSAFHVHDFSFHFSLAHLCNMIDGEAQVAADQFVADPTSAILPPFDQMQNVRLSDAVAEPADHFSLPFDPANLDSCLKALNEAPNGNTINLVGEAIHSRALTSM